MSLVFHDEPLRPVPRRIAPATVAGCRIDVIAAADAGALLPEWRALLARAVEPNPFADPDVLLPAALHLGDADPLSLVAVRQDADAGLIALVPLAPPGRSAGMAGARLWSNRHLPLATPLLASGNERLALRALLRWLGDRRPAFSGLVLPRQTAGGAFLAALAAVTLELGLPMATASAGAALPVSARAGVSTGCRDAVERLLGLDATEARLRTGRAILQDIGQTTFLRAATRALARAGRAGAAVTDGGEDPAEVLVQVGDGWRVWLAAGDPPPPEAAGDLALVDVHVALRAGGAPAAFTERARLGLARALWMAGRAG
jgi:hypothetical protein